MIETAGTGKAVCVTFSLAGLGIYFHLMYPYIVVCITFMLIDYVTGIIGAAMKGEINSKTAGIGLFKKLAYMIACLTGWFIDFSFTSLLQDSYAVKLPFNFPVGVIICVWVIVIEIISIFENLEKCGVVVPSFIRKFFLKTKEDISNK